MSLYDNYAAKNAASARAIAMTDSKKKSRPRTEPAVPKQGICDKCHKEALVRAFRSRIADPGDGVVSFGFVVRHYCVDCAPKSRRERDADVPQMDSKQVKNLMRSAKKGLL